MSISHPLDAALYARCCSPHQNQPGSIASQIDALRQRAAADGHVVAEQLCFIDEGCSGATLLRPALQRLRDQAASGVFHRLYIYSPDRLSRSHLHFLLLLEEFHRGGVEAVFCN